MLKQIGIMILKAAAATGALYYLWKRTPQSFEKSLTRDIANHGELYGKMSFAISLMFVFAIVYTMISIFWFCFTNYHFVLLVNGLPIPFLIKIVAGFVGVIVWTFGVSWLSHLLDKFAWADVFILLVYLPIFFWIDLGKLIYLIHEEHRENKIVKAIVESGNVESVVIEE